jgi:hypothetical protein
MVSQGAVCFSFIVSSAILAVQVSSSVGSAFLENGYLSGIEKQQPLA